MTTMPTVAPAGLPSGRVRRVTEFIQQNLDKELRLSQLASLVCMSPYHFARLFKSTTGVPPHQFVVRQRIARASALLAMPEPSIAHIARLVGFRTASHFTSAFRRVTGLTPTGYRREQVRNDRTRGSGG
jgi:AraC family transcriptional regulator